ncbi:MAG: bleomycin resistance family protein [Hyphomicrobiales bacterium]|nr:MAG: bleomycin resistance family protein [Hyphomicrobiales bacterium]
MTALVPEFAVSDIAESLKFYVDVLGFSIKYQRPEEGFAYLYIGAAELMLDQLNLGRDFNIDEKPPAYPFGRGLNVQIKVDDLTPMLDAINAEGLELYLPVEEKYYRMDNVDVGQKQFVIADPDGYLLRFCESLGNRPVSK